MSKLKPISITLESSDKFVVSSSCDGREETYLFSVEAGPTPVIHGDEVFNVRSSQYLESSIWITRAVSSFLLAQDGNFCISGEPTSVLNKLTMIKDFDSSAGIRFMASFDSANGKDRSCVFSVISDGTDYSVESEQGSWSGKFNNMRLDIDGDESILPLIQAILCLQRARDV